MSLSHWDIAVDFTADQAAALALGIDPASAGYTREKSVPLYQRIESCYNLKKDWLWGDMDPMGDGLAKPTMLESVALRWWSGQVEPDTWGDYCKWAKNGTESGVEFQRFTRQELARWLAVVEVNSIYQFDSPSVVKTVQSTPKVGPTNGLRWTPELLAELAAFKAKHGTKNAAAKFNISTARVRILLPQGTPKITGYSGFPQRKY